MNRPSVFEPTMIAILTATAASNMGPGFWQGFVYLGAVLWALIAALRLHERMTR